MELCVLSSGSSGNCILVQSGATKILIDAGLSGRETERRLAAINVAPNEIQGICLTHEHGDHVAGLRVLHSRYNIKLYANSGTAQALRRLPRFANLPWNIFTTGSKFQIGEVCIEPFAVSHDAYEPVGFIAHNSHVRAGIVTDIGVGTHLVRERLRGCHALVIESNHDEQMLIDSKRPEYLKQRIRSRQGHLSNRLAGELLAEIADANLQQVFLAHISSDCNQPELAISTINQILTKRGLAKVRLTLTSADKISETWRAETQGSEATL